MEELWILGKYYRELKRLQEDLPAASSFTEFSKHKEFWYLTNPLYFVFSIADFMTGAVYVDKDMNLCLTRLPDLERIFADSDLPVNAAINDYLFNKAGISMYKPDEEFYDTSIDNFYNLSDRKGDSLVPVKFHESAGYSLDWDIIDLLFDDFKEELLSIMKDKEEYLNEHFNEIFAGAEAERMIFFNESAAKNHIVFVKYWDDVVAGGGGFEPFTIIEGSPFEGIEKGVYCVPKKDVLRITQHMTAFSVELRYAFDPRLVEVNYRAKKL